MRSIVLLVCLVLCVSCKKKDSTAGWVSYLEPHSYFAARFPSTPEERDMSFDGPSGLVSAHAVLSQQGSTGIYSAMVMPYLIPEGTTIDVQKELEEAKTAMLSQVGRAKVTSISAIQRDGCEGLETIFEVSARGRSVTAIGRTFACSDQRMLVMAWVIQPSTKDDKLAVAFLDSVRMGQGIYETK